MSIVFVAGSRQISQIPAEVRSRLDTMIEKGFQILVGDAIGADKAVQRYLADRSYPNVLVHCMEDHCRNNVGKWPTRQLVPPHGAKGFDYYSVKDRKFGSSPLVLREPQDRVCSRSEPAARDLVRGDHSLFL